MTLISQVGALAPGFWSYWAGLSNEELALLSNSYLEAEIGPSKLKGLEAFGRGAQYWVDWIIIP